MRIRLDPIDKLFSRFIRLRAGGRCEYCRQVKPLQCSHYHGRRKRSTRWFEDNCSALCFSCHIYLGENPYQHTEWIKKRLGSERFELLNIRAETTCTKPDKEAIKRDLKEKISMLEMK